MTPRAFPSLRPYTAPLEATDHGSATRPPLHRLALNESPYGMCPRAKRALARELCRAHFYPDGNATALRAAIARAYSVSADMVLVGNGVDELLFVAALAFVSPGDLCVTTDQTFLDYRTDVELAGGQCLYLPLEGYRLPVPGIVRALQHKPAVLFVCNPHNPTGTALAATAVEQVAQAAARSGTVAVFDEAYAKYADPEQFGSALEHAREAGTALVMRTFSKLYGLAGLRCGYAIGPVPLIDRMRCVRNALPFNVNRLAQTAGRASILSPGFRDAVRVRNRRVREWLCERLAEAAVPFVPSQTNFVLVRLPCSGTAFCAQMRARGGTLLRDAAPFGLERHVRITVGTLSQMRQVMACLPAALASLA